MKIEQNEQNERNLADLPEKLDDLSQLKDLQGREMPIESANHLTRIQEEFLLSALEEGFANLKEEPSSQKEIDLRWLISALRENISQNNDNSRQDRQTSSFVFQASGINTLYQMIHDSGLPDKKKVFYELLTGLTAFHLATEMGRYVALRILPEKHPRKPELEKTTKTYFTDENAELTDYSSPDGTAALTGEILFQQYGGDAENFWKKFDTAVSSDENLAIAAQRLACLRNTPEKPAFLAIMQYLHWRGFGGTGELIKNIPELAPLARHSLSYFGAHDPNIKDRRFLHFNNRLALFGKILTPLKKKAAERTADFLKAQFPEKKDFKIYEAAAGPHAIAARQMADALNQIDDEITVHATESEVVGPNLVALNSLQRELHENRDHFQIDSIVYNDLSMHPDEVEPDKYDAYIISLGLHQVVDADLGNENLLNAIRFATGSVKEGGCIALTEVSGKANRQFGVIPANLVDREGFLNPNIHNRLSIHETAVPCGRGRVKIPLRKSDSLISSPKKMADSEGNSIYHFELYEIVIVDESILDDLEDLRNEGKFELMETSIRQNEVLRILNRTNSRILKT